MTAPRYIARRILQRIDKVLELPPGGWPEDVVTAIAEIVGDAQEEVRNGFLRPPDQRATKRSAV